MLKKEGYQVSAVKNGKEAVEAYGSAPGKYDMILMDVQMPVMDGREATKEIRRLEVEGKLNDRKSLHIPIIAVTAEAMKGERDRLLEIGMDDYISKPIKRDVVLEMVNKWGLRR
jgi:CheY-like chemotaxis protein